MALFDEMPRIESERLLLREMVDTDAEALDELAVSEAIYLFEPTFLYEQRYEDKHLAIARMREECFDTHESILLAVCLREQPEQMVGIAEIYAYEPRKPKASIGCRLLPDWWGKGIATEVAGMLREWLLDEAGMRTITAHVMIGNGASERTLEKAGYVLLYPHCWEDWGRGEPVLVDKWVYKRRWRESGPDVPA